MIYTGLSFLHESNSVLGNTFLILYSIVHMGRYGETVSNVQIEPTGLLRKDLVHFYLRCNFFIDRCSFHEDVMVIEIVLTVSNNSRRNIERTLYTIQRYLLIGPSSLFRSCFRHFLKAKLTINKLS